MCDSSTCVPAVGQQHSHSPAADVAADCPSCFGIQAEHARLQLLCALHCTVPHRAWAA